MSHIRRSSVRRLTDTLWLNDRGEKLQMADGLLIPSHQILTEAESKLADEFLKNWMFNPSKEA